MTHRSFQIEPINRFLHAAAIQSFMDGLNAELFPKGWPPVKLKDIPENEDDIWLAVYSEEGWLKGLIYCLKFDGLEGHNVHLVMGLELRGAALLPVLEEAMEEVFLQAEIQEVYAVIPCNFRHVRWLAAKLGFQPARPWVWFLTRDAYLKRHHS